MSKVKDQFINDLVDELNKFNNNRVRNKQNPLDICYMISVLDQQLDDCDEFMNDITIHRYKIDNYTEDNSGYTNGTIKILIGKPRNEKEAERMIYKYSGVCYYITFSSGEIYYEGWTIPTFEIVKKTNLYNVQWDGFKEDYDKYKDKFYDNEKYRNKKAEEYLRNKRTLEIKDEIEKLQNELKELNNVN